MIIDLLTLSSELVPQALKSQDLLICVARADEQLLSYDQKKKTVHDRSFFISEALFWC